MPTAARPPRPVSLLLAGLLCVLLTVPEAHAQFGKLKDKAKQATDQAANQIDPTKQSPAPAPAQAPAEAPAGEGAAQPAAQPASASAGGTAPAAPAAKEWANYDFVPGNRVIFFDDFTDDKVGNFPKRLEFVSGQMELVELDGVRMLKASDHSAFLVPLPEALPQKYTIEIDFISKNDMWNALSLWGGREEPGEYSFYQVGAQGVELYSKGAAVVNSWFSEAKKQALPGTLIHLRQQGDGGYLKLYANEARILNVPNSNLKRENALHVVMDGRGGGDLPVYIARIRVAESTADIYDALSSAGHWTTQGILFETGKSDLKPESTPTLKAIAGTLKAHPDLKVEIQGHTDNVGQAAANLTLSNARAAAVKAALVGQYGVSEAQLTTKGYGDTKPVAPNTTPEGRQNNRRVELVKQ